VKISNRRAFYDYKIEDSIEAGINLTGGEVKSVKAGHADLTGSFVRIIGSEAYLVNAKIFPYQKARAETIEEGRTRKLLLHKNQIISLKSRTEGANLALVPLSLYTKNGLIKVDVGIGSGKRKFEKKEAKKKRDLSRIVEDEIFDI